MSSLSSIVAVHGILRYGMRGDDVRAAQLALSQSGYKVGIDGDFFGGTENAVRRFQRQHGLDPDGRIGPKTAALLDAPHDILLATAQPELHQASGFPHDDTASLLAFYGDPRGGLEAWKGANVTTVSCPWALYYEGKPWLHPIPFHRKAADGLRRALTAIWDAAGRDNKSPLLARVKNFSGSGEFRAIRGSSRLSCHAFWAAIDFDAEHLPLGRGVASQDMPQAVVDAFRAEGFFWGGDYKGRKDPMHFQAAHE